jgi:two-component system heavy metal sensor histidine kinase CusS
VTVSVVRDSADAETIHLAVENTGEPIPPEHLSRLFDRFYRVDASRRHSGDGAGLGLAITRSILRSHGGDIEGRTGKEATFSRCGYRHRSSRPAARTDLFGCSQP